MTAEKRKKMQMYRKQAYIAEVRVKSRSREKEFMDKIQGALDEIRVGLILLYLKTCFKFHAVI